MKSLAYPRDPDFTIIINIVVFTLLITWASQNHCKKNPKSKICTKFGKEKYTKVIIAGLM